MLSTISTAITAVQMMVGDGASPELVIVSDPGSSGARVLIIRHPQGGRTYAVKCVKSGRVSLVEEIARREIIKPFLKDHLPEVLMIKQIGEYEVMISECRGEQTLHSLIINSLMSHDQLKRMWHEVVSTLVDTWQQTKYYPFMDMLCPRYHKARCQRIADGIYSMMINGVKITDCASLPIIINGEEYPSIKDLLPQIETIGKPLFGVTCHGDPQPSNIVVDKNRSWSLVDWEWSGKHHDWRVMVSHLHGWWSTRCSVLMVEPEIRLERKRLYINYSLMVPAHLAEYQQEAASAYWSMSDSLNDSEDINRYLATLYFGELRFLQFWGRQSYLAPFLAEAIKAVVRINGQTVPGDSAFIFNPKERR